MEFLFIVDYNDGKFWLCVCDKVVLEDQDIGIGLMLLSNGDFYGEIYKFLEWYGMVFKENEVLMNLVGGGEEVLIENVDLVLE